MNCNNKNGLVGFCICCVKGVQFKNFFQKWSDFEEFGNGGTKKNATWCQATDCLALFSFQLRFIQCCAE
jgi:hypothetical protein